MRTTSYNSIKRMPQQVATYLQTLSTEELLAAYSRSFQHNLNVPYLLRQLKAEIQRRNISEQKIAA